MNRIQQEAIAKSVGMTRDDLAKSLMDREALVALSGVEGKDAKEKYDNLEIIDYLLLSTTIQSGVGISDLYPTTFYGKLTMIIQQLVLIMTHVFTIYIFTV